jgi:aldose 1-epimerase
MRLNPARFAGRVQGREVGLCVIEGEDLSVALCNHGARILQILTPDRHGQLQDVVLGHDSLPQLLAGMPSMGAFIGRFANRIAKARFVYGGRAWQLPANDGPHCLHGGPGGSRHQVFDVLRHAPDHLSLGWTFREAEDGFPGEVALELHYRIAERTLWIEYSAQAQGAAMPLNFTSHAFFNLEGAQASQVLDHQLHMCAERVLSVGPDRIPTGQMRPVAGTAFDFRQARSLASALAQGDPQLSLGSAPGFDHCFVDARPGFRWQASLFAPGSGIAMDVGSDAPGLQLFSAAAFDGSLPRHAGKHGRIHGPSAAVCLEPQGLPDAPNQPGFPRAVFEPGQSAHGRMAYRFRTLR